jgi:O-methyltransferase
MPKKPTALSPRKRLINKVYPVHFPIVDRINRIPTFVQYLAKYPHVRVFAERSEVYQHVAGLLGPGPIDYLEFGVHQGESIREWSELNTHPESSFVGFDSFEGLPENWGDMKAGHFSTGGKTPDIADTRVHFVRGWFQDTLDGFLRNFKPRHRLVINNDSDLYSSTLYTLTRLDHLLVPGSLIFFDEFDDVQHEFRAVEDYSAAYRKTFRPLAADDRFRTAVLEVQ